MLGRDDVTAGELVERLNSAGLELLAGDPGRVVRSASCTVHDPLLPLTGAAAGVLLGVGVPVDEAPELVRAAAAAGHDVVVLRPQADAAPAPEFADAARETGVAVLGIAPASAWIQVERMVSSVLTGAARVTGAGTAGDLFDLANATASLVGGAVTVEDLAQRVLAYSTIEGQQIDEDRQASILGGRVPLLPENDEQYAAVLAADGPVRIEGVGDAMDRLAVAVRLAEETLGTMWVVDAHDELADDAAHLLARAAELAAMQMLQSRTASDFERERRAALVRAVVEGGGVARSAVSRLGLDPGGPFLVAALVTDEVGVTSEVAAQVRWNRFLTMVHAYVAGWVPAVGACELDGALYVLLSGEEAADVDRVLLNVEVLVRRGAALGLRVRVGVGSVATDPEGLRASRVEAEALVAVAADRDGVSVLTAEGDHSALALWTLRDVVRERPRILSPSALRLWEHDQRHGTTLVETLSTWFGSGMDTGRSAAALSVHPNTLRHRLRRAREISGVGAGADDLLMAWLTLRLTDEPRPRR